jgi:undecaprenyl-diphosphatase
MTRDWFGQLMGRGQTADSKLAWWILIGTLPAGVLGLLLKDYAEVALRSPVVMALALILFGLLLGWADWKHRGERDEHSLTLRDVLIIGFAQALALIPGTSRSGITMTAGLMVGLDRAAAARFSFLLSIPVILLAGGLNTLELARSPLPVEWTALLLGAALSAASAYLCIHLFLKALERIGMLPFVLYRLALGAVLLWIYL